MKRIAILLFICLSVYCIAQAQVNPHALGVRLGGDGSLNGAEISYQHGLNKINRLELDLGFANNKDHTRTFLVGIYQWDWVIEGGLNWYVGPGAALGFHSHDGSRSYLNIGIGGQIGLEYDFNYLDTPLLLSLDIRPIWDFLGDHAGFGWGTALGIRYTWQKIN